MAHIYPDTRSLLQILASSVVKMGEMPKHIAVIMDGNRRFAKSRGLQTKLGHQAGLLKAKEITRWGYEMKLQELTLYAFSIENFKRSKEQVDELMALLYDYCLEMVNGLQSAIDSDCCIQFIGSWDLIPSKLKPNMARIMLETRHCKTFKINIAMAYTGRNGILQSMQNIEKGIKSGHLQPQDVSEYLIDEAQNLVPMTPVDMLIRTGGDVRISDFMLWEASQAYIHFSDSAWPDFTCWEFLDSITKYQMFRKTCPKLSLTTDVKPAQKERINKFLEHIRQEKWDNLNKFAKKSNQPRNDARVYEETRFREGIKKLLVSL